MLRQFVISLAMQPRHDDTNVAGPILAGTQESTLQNDGLDLPRCRKPVSPALSDYLENEQDLLIARLTGLAPNTCNRLDPSITSFYESINELFPSAEPLQRAKSRLLRIDEDDLLSIPMDYPISHGLQEEEECSGFISPTNPSDFRQIPGVAGVKIEDLDISNATSSKQTPLAPSQSNAVHRILNKKPFPSIDSGISGISLATEQDPALLRQQNAIHRAMNAKSSTVTNDSGFDTCTGSLHAPNFSTISSQSPTLHGAEFTDPNNSATLDTPQSLDATKLAGIEAKIFQHGQSDRQLRLESTAKHKILDAASRHIVHWFNSRFQGAVLEASEVEIQTCEGQSSAQPTDKSRKGSNDRSGKRKRLENRDDDNNDDSDAETEPKQKKVKQISSLVTTREKFACPCFKRNPANHDQNSDCASHVWEIRRLK